MSKCWYCNEELTTANYCDEHIGICTKCYGAMFKVSNEFVKGLTDKIADLEAKLAESEKKILELQEDSIRDNQIYNEQLAEKEETIKEINKEFVQAVKDWKSLVEQKNRDIAELEEHDDLYHNQLAIAELERAKIEFETYYADNIWNYPQYLEDRIAELTHQHEDKGE